MTIRNISHGKKMLKGIVLRRKIGPSRESVKSGVCSVHFLDFFIPTWEVGASGAPLPSGNNYCGTIRLNDIVFVHYLFLYGY